jgi:hypothetical protein
MVGTHAGYHLLEKAEQEEYSRYGLTRDKNNSSPVQKRKRTIMTEYDASSNYPYSVAGDSSSMDPSNPFKPGLGQKEMDGPRS